MEIKYGCTRIAIVTKKWTFKIPNFICQYRHFVKGVLDNIKEKEISGNTSLDASIAKVLYCNFFGFILVMETVRRVNNNNIFFLELAELCAKQPKLSYFYLNDAKPDNFGYNKNNKFVKLDYADRLFGGEINVHSKER